MAEYAICQKTVLTAIWLKRGNQTAIIWEPNNPNEAARQVTYNELHHKVCQLANALQNLGVKKSDRICIYMPMIIEGAVAMLACARIGAIHSVVFAGFSAQSLIDRINDSSLQFDNYC
jgi:acetyl-CoA synthetase